MNMLSFYGGPAGKDFTITKIFPNKTAMDADIALGNNSPIYAGDYVLISYGDPNQPEFAENLTVDGDISYNATLWKKEWNNGYSYKEIMSIASNYPKFTAGNIDTSLKFGEAPQLTIDSSSLANPKVVLKMPASLRAGTANTTESVAPTATASIAPVYGGTLGNELSFQAKVPQGVTFTPSVSDAGEISWTNNGNLSNPATKSVKGPKGDNGDPGIVISATQPTAESHPVWINPEGEASPAGGTDISLGVTGATVGQIAKITAVDNTGKPTAWEAVNMPTGGGESTFEKLVEMTTLEDAAVISISTDKNGNPLSMSEFYVAITTARNSASTANNNFNCNVLPDTVPSHIRSVSAIKSLTLFQDVYCYVMHYKVVGGMIFHEYVSRVRTSSGLNVAKYLENEKNIGIRVSSGETTGFLSPSDASNGESKIDSAGKMYCITFGADSTECIFGAGTRVEVWAR